MTMTRLARYTDADLDLDLRWWAAANFLTVGQIYLQANPLLREPLRSEHIKPRLLGHWGTSPGLSMIYTLLNRLIRATDTDWIYVTGPGHGGPALVANCYLEGTYSEVYPQVGPDLAGLLRLVRQFSTPGGIPSHVSVQTPGQHPRRRRARVRPGARRRRRLRPPEPPRRLRHRRRRSGDRAARGVLEIAGLPPREARRRGITDPAPQRLQDLRSDDARASGRRAREPVASQPRVGSDCRRG